MDAPQRSPEWYAERLGHVTASMFGCVMKTKKNGDFSDSAITYMLDLIGERYAGQPSDDYESFAMKRGEELEPMARDAYEWRTGLLVTSCGFIRHPDELWIGGSPDGLVGDDGIIEIKCPLTYPNHVRVEYTGQIPEEHIAQCQGNLWITGRQWVDFMSYDPRMKKSGKDLFVIRQDRDQEYIDQLAKRVVEFRNMMLAAIENMGGKT